MTETSQPSAPTTPQPRGKLPLTARVRPEVDQEVNQLGFALSAPGALVSKAAMTEALLEAALQGLRVGALRAEHFGGPIGDRLREMAIQRGLTSTYVRPLAAPSPPEEPASGYARASQLSAAPPTKPPVEEPEDEALPERKVELDEEQPEGPGPLGSPKRGGGPGTLGESPRSKKAGRR